MEKETLEDHPLRIGDRSCEDRIGDGGNPTAVHPTPSTEEGFREKSGLMHIMKLAKEGSWKLCAEKCIEFLDQDMEGKDILTCHCFYSLALFKTRNYQECLAVIRALSEKSGTEYSDNDSDHLPFLLHVINALLPHFLGNSKSTEELLHDLVLCCERRLGRVITSAGDVAISLAELSVDSERCQGEEFSGADSLDKPIWEARLASVRMLLVDYYLVVRENAMALRWIDAMVQENPDDDFLLSLAVHVLVSLGEIEEAVALADDLRESILEREGHGQLRKEIECLLLKNEGALRFAQEEYGKARDAYCAALTACPDDVVAANNLALCYMYDEELSLAMGCLENFLTERSPSLLDETMVLNLCSMYELSSPASNEKKKQLRRWIISNGPDDFDLSATKVVFSKA